MKPDRVSWFRRCLLLLALGHPVAASAQTESEPIRLNYRPAAGCPDQSAFAARVYARTSRARLASADEGARTFTVTMHAGPSALGEVAIRARDGRPEGTRRVQGSTCEDVADALAMVVALAVDPQAHAPETPLATPGTATAGASAPAPPPSTPAPPASASAKQPAPPPAVVPLAPRARKEASAPESTPTRPRRAAWLLGADAALATGLAPELLVGPSPYVGWRAATGKLFDPSVRLAFVRAGTGPLDMASGKASFTWTAGRIDGCPVAWPSRGAARVVACVRLEAGVLQVAGDQVPAPQARTVAWLAAGPLARAEWGFLWPLFLDAEVGLSIHGARERFFFIPNATVYDMPLLGLNAAAGLGAHFP